MLWKVKHCVLKYMEAEYVNTEQSCGRPPTLLCPTPKTGGGPAYSRVPFGGSPDPGPAGCTILFTLYFFGSSVAKQRPQRAHPIPLPWP